MEKRKLSIKRSNEDFCSCNSCFARNYHSDSLIDKQVDGIYEVRIGCMVNTLCMDCLKELQKEIAQILL